MSAILVILEQRGGVWNSMSWDAVAAAQQLTQHTGQKVLTAVAGAGVASLASSLRGDDIGCFYAIEHALLGSYTADGFTLALEQFIRKLQPSYVIFPHTYQVRDFAPRLAARFEHVLVPDVVGIDFREGRPVFVRQLMQGKLSGDYRISGSGPCFVSIQAGAFRADGLSASSAELAVFTPELDAAQIRTKPEEPFREAAQTVDLSAANIIVSVGRGIREKDNLPIVEELAKAFGAELAASRPICDNGWLPMERQVGSSGQTVAPKLYVAVGISGAIQHLVGMMGSRAVVAINKDENAPIFEIADYGIVGDLFEVVPALTEALKRARGIAQGT
jgi:electron transfer flavoprotein alpha subunit